MKQRILVVEDESGVARGVKDALAYNGYSVDVAEDGTEGYRLARDGGYDLVVLDLMMPGLSGFEVLKRLRDENIMTPVLILTARGQEGDRVRGLDLGADDYVVKPFSVRELVARVGARLRRHVGEQAGDHKMTLGEVEFDFARREARRDGMLLPMMPKEFDLARFFLANRGRVITRDELLVKVWEYPASGLLTRTVDNYILKLRQKVESDPARPRIILTVRGKGYRLADA